MKQRTSFNAQVQLDNIDVKISTRLYDVGIYVIDSSYVEIEFQLTK